jgi:hypothetical protein
MAHPGRPATAEYAPYYETYIRLVDEEDVIGAMIAQNRATMSYLRALPPSAGDKRYAPGKWSVKEVIGHLIDAERVFTQRALFFARNAGTPLPSYDQETWNPVASFDKRELADLADEFDLVRRSDILFFQGLPADAWLRKGTGSGKEFSVRSLAYIIVGHERHHLGILRTKYV